MPTAHQLLAHCGLDLVDARVLLQHAAGVSRAWLIAHGGDPLPDAAANQFEKLAARRRAGEPVAYLIGWREFYGRDFAVSPAVLIPRPDTELLVELALKHAPRGARVLDLGTGSGCIPVTLKLERPDLTISAVDISLEALAVARNNMLRLDARLRLLASDWFGALSGERFDLIVSNPPYIDAGDVHLSRGDLRFEPRNALTDGGDGLAHVRRIVADAPAHLDAEGWLLFEHGYDQGAAARALLDAAGWREVQTWRDLGDNERVSGGRVPQA
ncbi:peptide chain release factor N(5)-glutamine methyltransferase [Chitiniphilus eburneus]|uniref:Release factor glutamine methyltransferase n=1 Tax=Chitiniphilus eburneus TaxID=2571148 RepID=A0A4U0PDI6_9NEIS|nr:peptide chain release factor N(5)-glutamine methyltransferase [Chitiniphilus eburneus]TJZ65811.1 peptide chain release factor N(5)-glutamine methyltransferase [Chitiniphilus eburneus]